MSSTRVLLVPHVTELEDLRRALEGGFILNPKVEGLGDVEELQVQDQKGESVAIIEHWLSTPAALQELLSESAADPTKMKGFLVRMIDWRQARAVMAILADRDRAWIYDADSSEILPGTDYARAARRDVALGY